MGGAFGFKLVVLKLESGDAPKKVAAFYRKALAKYGPVLDCSNPPATPAGKDHAATLTCGDDKPDPGGQLFKAGSKEKQHLVSVKPSGSARVLHCCISRRAAEITLFCSHFDALQNSL